MYLYHNFLIHSSADGHLGCFHVLAIVNSAETEDLYIENYKTLMKEINDDTIDGEIYHGRGLEDSI